MKKRNIGKIAGLMAAVAIWIGASSSGNAALVFGFPMNYATADIVGTAEGFNGDNPGNDASWLAQNLLNVVGLNATATYPLGNPLTTAGTDTEPTRVYHNSSVVDYSGTIQGLGIKSETPANAPFITAGTVAGVSYDSVHAPSGYQYAIAKYDGKNAGWVMFYLNYQDAYIPKLSQSFWGTAGTDQYAISSFTVFNAVPEPTTMIAGALLLLPFGASTIRFLRKNRMA
jgi:hypothetical protein